MGKQYDFQVESLGPCKLSSPIRMSTKSGDGISNYVSDNDRILYDIDAKIVDGEAVPVNSDTVELAGPRAEIYFNPSHVHAAICTCGGICPGLNNVIRAVVRCFWYRYGVRRISGIQYGYLGLLENSPWPLIPLDPDVVDDIQEKGGTILGSARGGGKQVVLRLAAFQVGDACRAGNAEADEPPPGKGKMDVEDFLGKPHDLFFRGIDKDEPLAACQGKTAENGEKSDGGTLHQSSPL